jgi:O-antigen/teichoic acid export membrane protein
MRNLVAALLKTSSSSVANALFGMASIKIIALLLGPSGVGLFSLIKQTVLTMASVGWGGQTGLVQGVAKKEGPDQRTYLKTTFWLFLWGTVVTVLIIQIFSPMIAGLVFGRSDDPTTTLIRWISLPVVLTNTYIYLKSILNGFREIGKLALIDVFGPIAMLLLVYPICTSVGNGYALAFIWLISLSQATMILASFAIVYKKGWLPPLLGLRGFGIDQAASKYFFRIAGTTFVTALLGMGTILAVRSMVTRHGGFYEAGLFDLAWTLSGAYIMFLLGSAGIYYMPLFSGTSEPAKRLILINQVMRLFTLLMVPIIVGIITLKPLAVTIFYSKEFMPSLDILRWMLIGDYLRITSWVFAITAIASTDMKVYFWGEASWNIGFVTLSALAIFGFNEVQGVAVAFVVLYACFAIYYLQYVRRNHGFYLRSDLVLPWIIGFVLVLIVSWQTWDDKIVNWRLSSFWITASIAFVPIMLKKEERTILWSKLPWNNRHC